MFVYLQRCEATSAKILVSSKFDLDMLDSKGTDAVRFGNTILLDNFPPKYAKNLRYDTKKVSLEFCNDRSWKLFLHFRSSDF